MKIICLGWGSLIWDPCSLPVCGYWKCDGPVLPVEFTRQSKDGRITLVITSGAKPVPVLWADLAVTSIEDAREVLRKREGCQIGAVGYWTSVGASKLDETATIGLWAEAKGITGVVWTALKPKFGDTYRIAVADEVYEYLANLSGKKKAMAEEYVRRAPAQIRTAYRQRLESELGWHPIDAKS